MELVTEKWGGRPHYRGQVHVLGDDVHGTWVWGPAGRSISRGGEPLFVTEQDALILLVPETWWSPAWWLGHPDVEVYVNIGTPPLWSADRVSSTDLDLDVIRFGDDRLEVVDRDEFELHQQAFGYPEEAVATAERAASIVFELMAARVPPFDGRTSERWVAEARARALPPLR